MRRSQKFTEVYNTYKGLIMKFIYGKVESHEDAEELTQDVFMSYYKSMDRVDDEMLKFWLLLAARNRCIDLYRKRMVRRETPYHGGMESVEICRQNNLELVVEKIIREEFAYRILGDLEVTHKKWYDALVLVSVYGMTQAEAAEHLNVRGEVFRSRLFRARRFVRARYEEEYRQL